MTFSCCCCVGSTFNDTLEEDENIMIHDENHLHFDDIHSNFSFHSILFDACLIYAGFYTISQFLFYYALSRSLTRSLNFIISSPFRHQPHEPIPVFAECSLIFLSFFSLYPCSIHVLHNPRTYSFIMPHHQTSDNG